jgi:fibronectin-binding autotransporter adhesin
MKKGRHNSRRFAAFASAAIALALADAAPAVSVSWDGGGGANRSWHLPANWTTDTLPTLTTDTTLGSGITSGLLIDIKGGDPSAQKLIISTIQAFSIVNTSAVPNERFRLGANLLREDLTGTEADQTIDWFVSIGGNANWDVNGSGWLTVRSVFDEGGTFNFAKNGNGSLSLLDSSYRGLTTVNAGILRLRGSSSSSGFLVNSELQVEGLFAPVSMSMGVAGGAALHHLSSTTSLGVLTLVGDDVRLISDSGSLRFNGGISDNGAGYSITKSGAGNLFLNGPGNYSGTTSINGGTLTIGVNDALGSGLTTVRSGGILQLGVTGGVTLATPIELNGGLITTQTNGTITGAITLTKHSEIEVPGSNNLNITAPITASGPHILTKIGTGTLELGSAGTLTGGIVVSAGTLYPTTEEALPSEVETRAAGEGTIMLHHRSSFHNPFRLSGNGAAGVGALYLPSGDATVSGPIALQSAAAVGVGAGGTLTLSGAISGNFALTKVGAGELRFFREENSFGSLTVAAGTLRLDRSQPLPPGAPITVALGASVRLFGEVTYASSLNLSPSNSPSVPPLLDNASGENNWSGPITLLGESTVGASADRLTISGTISGPFALFKRGAGEVALSGANNFPWLAHQEGIVTLQSTGAMAANSVAVVAAGATVQLKNNISTPSDVTAALAGHGIGGEGALFNASGNNTFGGPVNLISSSSIGAAAGTMLTLSNAISDGFLTPPLPLVKVGPGTLALTGANSYRGGVIVNAGTLSINGDSRLGPASNMVTLNNGGKLLIAASMSTGRIFNLNTGSIQVDPGFTLSYNGATVSGGFLRGPGIHSISGASNFSGVTALAGSNIDQTAAATLNNVTNAGRLTSTAPLVWDGGFNTSAGSLIVNSTANVTAFENTGAITINGGGGTLINSVNNLVSGGGGRITINPGGQIDLNTTSLDLVGSLLINNGRVNGATNVGFGSLAKGAGVYGAVNVTDGGKFSPGNSPGSVTTGSSTWNSGGNYIVELADALAGAGVGWDFWDVDGILDVNASSSSNGRFVISLASLLGESSGPAANFDPTRDYSWVILHADNGITGLDPTEIVLDTSAFKNNLGSGRFSLSSTANELAIHFSSVPEPTALLGFFAATLLSNRRPRRRQPDRTTV